MKKKYVLGILTAVVLMFGITACGKTTESTPEQNATQEEQKEDQDNDTSDQDVNQDGQNEQDQTQQEQTENTQDANNLGAGTITVYAQNKDVSGFDKKEVSLEAITPETVLSQLAAAGVLPSDTTVLSFTKKEKDGEQVIDLDLSEKFGTYIKEMGSSAEYLVIGSICNTYLDVYHCAKISHYSKRRNACHRTRGVSGLYDKIFLKRIKAPVRGSGSMMQASLTGCFLFMQ